MKLVMIYYLSHGEGSGWSQRTLPIDYDNVEKAELDFLETWENHKNKEFSFANHGFDWCEHQWDGVYEEPRFLTLDDWWEQNK